MRIYLFLVITSILCVCDNIYALVCSMTANDLNFGTYDISSLSPKLVNTSLTVHCDATASVLVRLSTGSSGSYINRTMLSSSNSIKYNLYTSSQYSVVWGNGSGGTGTVPFNMNLSNGYTAQRNAYGRVLPQQLVPPGSYNDQITASFDY